MANRIDDPCLFDFGDFWGSEEVALMTGDQVAGYLRLLAYQWAEGSIPDDPRKIAGILTGGARFYRPEDVEGEFWDAVIRPCFRGLDGSPDRLANPRMAEDRESWLAKKEGFIDQRRQAGLASGKARRKKARQKAKKRTAVERPLNDRSTEAERDANEVATKSNSSSSSLSPEEEDPSKQGSSLVGAGADPPVETDHPWITCQTGEWWPSPAEQEEIGKALAEHAPGVGVEAYLASLVEETAECATCRPGRPDTACRWACGKIKSKPPIPEPEIDRLAQTFAKGLEILSRHRPKPITRPCVATTKAGRQRRRELAELIASADGDSGRAEAALLGLLLSPNHNGDRGLYLEPRYAAKDVSGYVDRYPGSWEAFEAQLRNGGRGQLGIAPPRPGVVQAQPADAITQALRSRRAQGR